MPYAYERQTKSGPGFTQNEVITALETFLAYDPSWTVLQNISLTAGRGDLPALTDYSVLHKTNGNSTEDVVIHLWQSNYNENNFGMNTSTGPANLTLPWNQQPGARVAGSTTCYTQTQGCSNDIVDYHFFGYPEYVYVVFKTSADIWRSFAFGHIEKLSAVVGGGFACCSTYLCRNTESDQAGTDHHNIFFDGVVATEGGRYRLISQVRADTKASTLRYIIGGEINAVGPEIVNSNYIGPNDIYSNSGGVYNGESGTNSRQFEYDKMRRAPSNFSVTAPLIPIYIYMGRGSEYISLVGRLQHVFAMNIKNISETSEITIQGDQYVVFPYARKTTSINPGDNKPNSYYHGMALLKRLV